MSNRRAALALAVMLGITGAAALLFDLTEPQATSPAEAPSFNPPAYDPLTEPGDIQTDPPVGTGTPAPLRPSPAVSAGATAPAATPPAPASPTSAPKPPAAAPPPPPPAPKPTTAAPPPPAPSPPPPTTPPAPPPASPTPSDGGTTIIDLPDIIF